MPPGPQPHRALEVWQRLFQPQNFCCRDRRPRKFSGQPIHVSVVWMCALVASFLSRGYGPFVQSFQDFTPGNGAPGCSLSGDRRPCREPEYCAPQPIPQPALQPPEPAVGPARHLRPAQSPKAAPDLRRCLPPGQSGAYDPQTGQIRRVLTAAHIGEFYGFSDRAVSDLSQ